MTIKKYYIEHIEKALDLKLYDSQIKYLLGKGHLMQGRATGKTLAYCIKLALSDGDTLDLKKPEKFADKEPLVLRRGEREYINYSRNLFRNEFMDIREKLKIYGFKVREVKVK